MCVDMCLSVNGFIEKHGHILGHIMHILPRMSHTSVNASIEQRGEQRFRNNNKIRTWSTV